MPNDEIENKNAIAPNANKGNELQAIGTPNTPLTIKVSESIATVNNTKPFATILATAISLEVTGITNKCSMVPRSRSRITAAPTNSNTSKFKFPTICIVPISHLLEWFGLYSTLIVARLSNEAEFNPKYCATS